MNVGSASRAFGLLAALVALGCAPAPRAPAPRAPAPVEASRIDEPSLCPTEVPPGWSRSPPRREDEVWDQPRVGTTVEELCAGWLRDMAPFGQGNLEQEPPTCTTGDGLPVQGALPEGQSAAGGVVLRYRIGAIACTDHALVFRASGGRLLGGPVYRSDDAAGDGGEFLAARASVVTTANGPALVAATVSSFGIVDGAATTPEGPQVFHHAARSCLCTARGYACDAFEVFERTRMDPESSRLFLSAPIPEVPALDPQGHVRAAPRAP